MTEYKPKPLPFDELFSLPSFSLLKLSKDKKKLAFYYDVTGRIELYVMDLESKEMKQISNGEVPRAPRTGFIWDTEGTQIFFGKDEDGNEQNDIWSINLEGEAKALTVTPTFQEHVLDISNDNQWISFMSTRSGQLNIHKMKKDGSEMKQLSASDLPVRGGNWSPDDKWIAMSTNELKIKLDNNDIYLYDVENNTMDRVIRITEEGSKENFNDWSPDSKSFAFSSDSNGLGQVGIFFLENKEITWVGDGAYKEKNARFNPSGKRLAVLRDHEAKVTPIIYDLESNKARELKIPSGLAYYIQWIDNNKILFLFTTPTDRPELWTYDLESDTYEVQINAEYGSIDKTNFVKPEYIKYKTDDGTEIAAILYKPKDVPGDIKLPAIINIHGGPTGQYFLSFSARYQYMASEGFVVILPNVRGSTGYGVEFRDACIKDWGGKDLQDIVYAKKYLEKLPYIDPDRIGVGGGSYGGYLTFMAVTKAPEHWKAGFAWIGISDLLKLYDDQMPHLKYYLNIQMGDPIADKELWYDRSAVNFAQNMTSHLLILHGVNDPRCPISQARDFRDKLVEHGKEEGKDFEYVEYEKVGHGGMGDIETRKMSIKAMMDYYKRRL
ncbi:MAG: S9 family peptidase [Asgard group archaeon]|nr:S9 family peptidase [Asgard group archaeon]